MMGRKYAKEYEHVVWQKNLGLVIRNAKDHVGLIKTYIRPKPQTSRSAAGLKNLAMVNGSVATSERSRSMVSMM